MSERAKTVRDNRRTALVLASIALVFFVGVMLRYVVYQ
jgi:hypothetical protein